MFWFVIRIDDILFPSITCYEADKLCSRKAELFSKAEFSLKSFQKQHEFEEKAFDSNFKSKSFNWNQNLLDWTLILL